MHIPWSAVVQNLMALIKYAVVLIAVVLVSKFFFNRDMCKVDAQDPGMRPAIGSTRTWLDCDSNAWAEPELGDIVTVYRESGSTSQDSKAFPFRAVAVGGDWMLVDGGSVTRYRDRSDREGQGENYPGATVRPSGSMPPMPRTMVPRGYVYLLSDNRQDEVVGGPGLIPVSQILAKVRL